MTQFKLLSAAAIALAVLAGPSSAREKHPNLRVRDAHAAVPAMPVSSIDCVRAPAVGAFATAPWTIPPCEPR
ncbi:hypothetical protein [Bradyrhizobium sp. STM 3557]|uniref:hypothetical protein n=1 Tax=Bradyrhizobium sp. STM 3557 TaxID=578920 RepID=UPI0038902601